MKKTLLITTMLALVAVTGFARTEVSHDEFKVLSKKSTLVGNGTYDTVWASALGRRIIQEMYGDADAKGNLIITVRLTAEDR